MTLVKNAISSFIDKFDGTPVQLEMVLFDSKATVLGTTGWSRYFDMLNSADVATLRSSLSVPRSSGSTNYEDAWYRTFFNSDGTTQSRIIPGLVVMFTDGIPNYSRLNATNATGPTSPPAALVGYPSANGSGYNQEAFYRANEIARLFRSTVQFIGVGVGTEIAGTSSWINSVSGWHYTNQKGYHAAVERSFHYQRSFHYRRSFHYQRSFQYQAKVGSVWTVMLPTDPRYTSASNGSKRTVYEAALNNSFDFWDADATPANYNAAVTGGRRITYEVPTGSNDYWETTTQTLFNANNTTPDETDGWRDKAYSSPFLSWETTTQTLYNANNTTNDGLDGWQVIQDYSLPFASFTTNSVTMNNSTILTRLIAGNDYGVTGILSGGVYTNATQANMYILPDYTAFPAALQAVALAQCGGTITMQTKVGASAAAEPFTYQTTSTKDVSGTTVNMGQNAVTTSAQFTSGTLDFSISSGQYLTVDIQPQNLSDLTAYQPVSWSCKAGPNVRSFTTIPIAGTTWTGVRVQVAANEAVSCTQTVTRVTP